MRLFGLSFTGRWRTLVIYLVVCAATSVLFVISIGIGEVKMPPGDVVAALLGAGTPTQRFIVAELRLPRALVALGAGLALGSSGALIQAVTRNPLASPDILGIMSGASAGAVAAIVLGGGATGSSLGAIGAPAAAILGGLCAAAAVFLLSSQRRGDSMLIILVGIGISAMSGALTSMLLVAARLHEASQALVWLIGSLDGRDGSHVWPPLVAVIIIWPLLIPLGFSLRAFAVGEPLAASLGVRAGRVRLLALVFATVLAAAAVAAAGPIAFLAFAAPQVAMRLIGASTPPVFGGGITGALLLMATDVATRTLLPVELPVGIVTVGLGAPLFLILLVSRRRRLTV